MGGIYDRGIVKYHELSFLHLIALEYIYRRKFDEAGNIRYNTIENLSVIHAFLRREASL